jgi:hypothetical protein
MKVAPRGDVAREKAENWQDAQAINYRFCKKAWNEIISTLFASFSLAIFLQRATIGGGKG